MDQVICPNCKETNLPNATFCSHCGRNLKDEQQFNYGQTSASVQSEEQDRQNQAFPYVQPTGNADKGAIALSHSGLGIASFIISIIVGVLLFLSLFGTSVIQFSLPYDQMEGFFMIVGLMICGGGFVDLVALGLGIAGLVQKNKKKIFPILGTVISGLTLIGIVILYIIGSVAI